MYWLFDRKNISSTKNGPIILERFFGQYTVRAGGVQQTGDELNTIWRYSFKKIKQAVVAKPNIFMLGLGAGGALKDLYTIFPGCSIIAVEYDPHMVRLARELKLCTPFPLPTILEGDAGEILANVSVRFDLIVIDLFYGSKVSPLVTQEKFLIDLKNCLAPNGIILINVFLQPHALETANSIFKHTSQWKYTSNTVGAFWEDIVKRQNM